MKFFPSKIISLALLFLFCGALVVQAQAQARPQVQAQGQRWLLVFGTSSAMKKRLPAVDAEIKTLLGTGFGGKISEGDSLAIWTLGDKLKAGEYPLISWSSENIPVMTTNLISYIHGQSFSGSAKLSALQPILGQVVADSDRLTILIFCDGTEQINWSPYDDGINDTLRQTAAERKKSEQPVVVVLRSQKGKFIGGMVNFPPVPLNLPSFPQSPGATNPAALAAGGVSNLPSSAAAPKPAAPVTSLVIIGTHISTDAADLTNAAPVSSNVVQAVAPKINLPVVVPAPVAKTNPPVPASVTVTNIVVAVVQPLVTDTNQAVASASPDDRIEKFLTYGGLGLLVVAAGLVIFLMRRRNAPQSSLITSSMQEKFRSNDPK